MSSNLFIGKEAYIDLLSPNIDRRLHELSEIDRQAHLTKKRPITICISRRYGCEALEFANQLKSTLETKTSEKWIIYDKFLLNKIAEEKNLAPGFFDILQKEAGFISILMEPFSTHWTKQHAAYRMVLESLLQIAERGNAIIIGRGASLMLQDREHCFHFRLEAPMQYRVDSIKRRLNIDEPEAKEIVIQNQKKRDQYIQSFFGKDITNPELYHSIFNCGKISMPMITECAMQIMKNRS